MNLLKLIDYVDKDLMNYYLDTFESDDLEELITYLHKCGNTNSDIIEIFRDYQSFWYSISNYNDTIL